MKQLYAEKTVFEKTMIWAQGIEQWMPLSSVAQFRWTICSEKAQSSSEF